MGVPLLACYRNCGSAGTGWFKAAAGFLKLPDPKYLAWSASHQLVIESPQAFSIHGYNALAQVRKLNPDVKLVAHVLTRMHDAQPDLRPDKQGGTYYGRFAAALPKDGEHRMKDGAGNPTAFIDLIYYNDQWIDFIKREVLDARHADGSWVWDGLMVDYDPDVAWDGFASAFDPQANGYGSKADIDAAWRKERARRWERLARLVRPGFVLAINGPPTPQSGMVLIENFPHQNHGTFEALMKLKEARPDLKPILFAAVDVRAAPPGSEAFYLKREHVLACAAAFDGYACLEPPEPEDGSRFWDWPAREPLDLGKPQGPLAPTRFNGEWGREFQRGRVYIEPGWRAGTGRSWIVGGAGL